MRSGVARTIGGVLALALSLATGGCGSEGAAQARPSGSVSAKTSVPSPVGSWVFDADGYAEENWDLIHRGVAPAVTAMRQQQARIAALPPESRAEAERLLRERPGAPVLVAERG
jgi:hypothetical protein